MKDQTRDDSPTRKSPELLPSDKLVRCQCCGRRNLRAKHVWDANYESFECQDCNTYHCRQCIYVNEQNRSKPLCAVCSRKRDTNFAVDVSRMNCCRPRVSPERPTLVVILDEESAFNGYYLKLTPLSEDEKRLLEFCSESSNKDEHRAKMASLLVETGQPSAERRYGSDLYAELARELLGNPDYDPARGECWAALKNNHNGLGAVVYHFNGTW